MSFPRSSLALLLAVAAMGACGEDNGTNPQPQTSVAIVSGNAQSGQVGAALANDVVVRVSRDGSGVQGTSVAWSVTAGGGSVNPTTSTTDADGLASTTWTLGPSAGANTVQAAVSGATGSPVSFSATGTAGPPPNQASVTVGDFFFDPNATTIALGGQVTWTWAGSAQHNVTFSTGSNSATQAAGTFQRTFNTAGSFPYQCTLHPASMQGTITVQ